MELEPVSQELENLEKIIEDGLQSFVAVGNALMEIKLDKKYKERGFKTFEEYCKNRFGFSRAHAYRNIQASSVSQILSPMGDKNLDERKARELAPLLPDKPKLVEAWGLVQEKHGTQATASQIKNVVKSITQNTEKPEPEEEHFIDVTPESKPKGSSKTYREIFDLESQLMIEKPEAVIGYPPELVIRCAIDRQEIEQWLNNLKQAESKLRKYIKKLELELE